MTIKANGALARYLGICVWEKYYRPSNFCSLFWMTLFGPLIFILLSPKGIGRGLGRVSNRIGFKLDQAIYNSRRRKVQSLLDLYKKDPKEAEQDYFEHIWYDLRKEDRKRNRLLVRQALGCCGDYNLWPEDLYGVGSRLASIGCDLSDENMIAIKERLWGEQETKTRNNVINKTFDVADKVFEKFPTVVFKYYGAALAYCAVLLAISGTHYVVFNKEYSPEFDFVAICVLAGFTLQGLYRSSGLGKFISTGYRAFKEKTCPIIRYEE